MFNNNPDFFPTPATLIAKMLDKIDFKYISSILENSAGKGDLADAIIEKFKLSRSHYYNREAVWDIDTVELNSELRMILKGKGYRVVHDDYLTYNTYKHYDAIISNPPFSIGDKFLLKMIEMQEYQGGVIVSLLGAETLRNPYSNTRKELLDKLEHYNAEIEYIQNAFIDSERSTNVEVALIYISIPKPEHSSIILDDLMKQEQFREEVHYNNEIVNADFLKG
ncbi:MAG TPA: DNA methyltransferase, partial [Clostridiales bacterium]|nr:DNA methyltransferase [Clostridiales bacterium]